MQVLIKVVLFSWLFNASAKKVPESSAINFCFYPLLMELGEVWDKDLLLTFVKLWPLDRW